jgi:hypothetical protein
MDLAGGGPWTSVRGPLHTPKSYGAPYTNETAMAEPNRQRGGEAGVTRSNASRLSGGLPGEPFGGSSARPEGEEGSVLNYADGGAIPQMRSQPGRGAGFLLTAPRERRGVGFGDRHSAPAPGRFRDYRVHWLGSDRRTLRRLSICPSHRHSPSIGGEKLYKRVACAWLVIARKSIGQWLGCFVPSASDVNL